MRRAWLVAALVAVPAAARADRVTVQVVEVAGDVAYVTPGKAAGLAPGAKVAFGGQARAILEVTDTTAAVKLDGLAVAVGQTGTVDAAQGAAAAGANGQPLRAEPPAAGAWPAPAKPADSQTVKPVPLGNGPQRTAGAHVTAIASGYAAIGRGAQTADGEARVIASWDVLANRPLSIDADVAGRVYSEGYDASLRVPVFVRMAQLRYGSAIDPALAIGRLRFAAASVGMLDGVRGAFHLGALELAAFGGIVPDAISGKPDTSATRFGVEATYDLATAPWRPRVSLAATGSTWSGTLDERRLALSASASRGDVSLGAWGEAQQFASDNPWGARTVELTGAGATAEWRGTTAHAGVDLDFARPERSLRLAALLPPSWLCTGEPVAGTATEACRPGDYWATATGSAGLRAGRFSVDAYGELGRTHLVTTSFDASAYVRGEVRLGPERLSLGGSVGTAAFATWNAGEIGAATARWAPLDIAVRYRAELLDYAASTGRQLLHAVAADVRVPCSRTTDLGLSALGTTGPDRSLVALLATVVWRPLP